ncbi:hypothetical protein [Kitasatospora purpeofusca]|uniref:hypothetical protein n=1 Tax=Kitasatospora purpeofusca TaxID=67352 RepID=UPI0036CA8C46
MTPRRGRSTSKTKAAAPLLKAPVQLALSNPDALVRELRDLHEKYGSADSMPDDSELYGALLWTERHAADLRRAPDAVRQRAALARVQLWQHLREQLDRHQLAAVDDARAAGVEWAALAGPLAVAAASAAYNRAARMRAAGMIDPEGQPIRRTPEAVVHTLAQIANEQRKAQRREAAAAGLHAAVAAAAGRLVASRKELPPDEDVQDWIDEVELTLADCDAAAQQVRLHRYVVATVRALHRFTRTHGSPPATASEALAAVAAANALPQPDGA